MLKSSGTERWIKSETESNYSPCLCQDTRSRLRSGLLLLTLLGLQLPSSQRDVAANLLGNVFFVWKCEANIKMLQFNLEEKRQDWVGSRTG